MGAAGKLDHFRGVAGEISDGGIDLPKSDLHILSVKQESGVVLRRLHAILCSCDLGGEEIKPKHSGILFKQLLNARSPRRTFPHRGRLSMFFVARVVANVGALHPEDYVLRDIGGVIGDAFEIAGHQKRIKGLPD